MNGFKITLFAGVFLLSGTTNAALLERLGGLAYYDTEANLTWLTDAVYSQSSGPFDPMTWADANNWASNLSVSGIDDWRLPSSDTCIGTNCTSSEMGNMFYNVLGGVAESNILTTHNANYDLFSNLLPRMYWSASESGGTSVYVFNMWSGYQVANTKLDTGYAWAVRTGDISAVPVPAAVWLFGSGLIGIFGFAQRKT